MNIHAARTSLLRLRQCLLGLIGLSLLLACEQEIPQAQGPVYTSSPDQGLATYHFAIHIGYNPKKLTQLYQPLMDYLNQSTPSVVFELEASRDFPAFVAKFNAREPEFLLANPWQTLEAMKAGYQVIAIAGRAEDFRGTFIVRNDSPIKTPADVRGKTVSYPAPTAIAACVMPQYYLHSHGININRDIINLYVGSQDSAIMSAYLKQSDIAASWPSAWRAFQLDHPKEAAGMRVIWETPHLQNNAILARDDVPAALRDQLRQTLINLHNSAAGRAILLNMQTEIFSAADDTDYNAVRDYLNRFEQEVRRIETP